MKYDHLTTQEAQIILTLNREQQDAVLEAQSYGLVNMSIERIAIIESIIWDLKVAIHP